MRFIVISDIHGAFENLEKVLKYAQKTGRAILFCGDVIGYPDEKAIPKEKEKQHEWFKQFAKEQWAKFIEICEKYRDVKIYSVLGNYDPKQLAKDEKFAKNNLNVEVNPQTSQNLKICGLGGAEVVVSFLRNLGYVQLITSKQLSSKRACDVFISHEPPQNYGDLSYFVKFSNYSLIVFPDEKTTNALKQMKPEDSLIDLLIETGDLKKEDLKENKKRNKEEQKEIDTLKSLKKKDVLTKHVGNPFLRKFVENNTKTKLLVVGHIHSGRAALEAKTLREIKPGHTIFTTLILNPGPLMEGHFAEVEVSKRKVKFIGFKKVNQI